MKICLINPGKYHAQPPLSLAYMAVFVRKYSESKHEIKIVDQNANENVLDEVLKFEPDIVGITATTPQISDAIKISNFVKENFSNAPITIGGIHVSALPKETLSINNFDIGVIGEEEQTFLDLINLFENNYKPSYLELSKIKT
jgi:radical SAM superfamily enzyme YgiQ (UPF0313 family)